MARRTRACAAVRKHMQACELDVELPWPRRSEHRVIHAAHATDGSDEIISLAKKMVRGSTRVSVTRSLPEPLVFSALYMAS